MKKILIKWSTAKSECSEDGNKKVKKTTKPLIELSDNNKKENIYKNITHK